MIPVKTHLDLFSGIGRGGFALAATWAGYTTVQFVEIDAFCQRVLTKHWPEVPIHDDIRTFDARPFRNAVDLLTGGFPCQPYSVAGKRGGASDDRALWPEMRRVVGEARPRWIVAENVPGFIGLGLDDLLADLEAIGYETGALVVPAAGVGAPHRRDRLWIVAHAEREQSGQRRDADSIGRRTNQAEQAGLGGRDVADAKSARHQATIGQPGRAGAQVSLSRSSCEDAADPDEGRRGAWLRHVHARQSDAQGSSWWLTEPDVGRVAHGIPARVDRLKSLGNSIVPQVAYEVIRHLEAA